MAAHTHTQSASKIFILFDSFAEAASYFHYIIKAIKTIRMNNAHIRFVERWTLRFRCDDADRNWISFCRNDKKLPRLSLPFFPVRCSFGHSNGRGLSNLYSMIMFALPDIRYNCSLSDTECAQTHTHTHHTNESIETLKHCGTPNSDWLYRYVFHVHTNYIVCRFCTLDAKHLLCVCVQVKKAK